MIVAIIWIKETTSSRVPFEQFAAFKPTHLFGRFFNDFELKMLKRMKIKYVDVLPIADVFAYAPVATVVGALKFASSTVFAPPYTVTDLYDNPPDFSSLKQNTSSGYFQDYRPRAENDFVTIVDNKMNEIFSLTWYNDVLPTLTKYVKLPYSHVPCRDFVYLEARTFDTKCNFVDYETKMSETKRDLEFFVRKIFQISEEHEYDSDFFNMYNHPYDAYKKLVECHIRQFDLIEIENETVYCSEAPISPSLQAKLEFHAKTCPKIANLLKVSNSHMRWYTTGKEDSSDDEK